MLEFDLLILYATASMVICLSIATMYYLQFDEIESMEKLNLHHKLYPYQKVSLSETTTKLGVYLVLCRLYYTSIE